MPRLMMFSPAQVSQSVRDDFKDGMFSHTCSEMRFSADNDVRNKIGTGLKQIDQVRSGQSKLDPVGTGSIKNQFAKTNVQLSWPGRQMIEHKFEKSDLTKLCYIWKVVANNFLAKLATFLGYFEKYQNLLWLLSRQLLAKIGQLFIPISSYT